MSFILSVYLSEVPLHVVQLSLSEDHYDQLRSEAYDLGTVSEDCELDGHEQHGVTLPPYEQVLYIQYM